MINSFVSLLETSPLFAIVPELLMILGLLISLFSELAPKRINLKYFNASLSLLAAIFCLFALLGLEGHEADLTRQTYEQHIYVFYSSFTINYLTMLFKTLVFFLAACLFLAADFKTLSDTNTQDKTKSRFDFLLFAAILGASCLISSNDLILFLVSLELMALSSIAMVAINRLDSLSIEAAIKYLLCGAAASAFMIFGFSLLISMNFTGDASGQTIISTNFGALLNSFVYASDTMARNFSFVFFGIALSLIAFPLAFKLSLFPFHGWAPDTYQGANIYTTAFLATISKIAGICAFLRLSYAVFLPISIFAGELTIGGASQQTGLFYSLLSRTPLGLWFLLFSVLAVISMWFGNFMGLRQVTKENKESSLKRIMAFSSMAQVGYIVGCICIDPDFALDSAIFFLIIYSIFNLATFLGLSKIKSDSPEALKGLFKVNPSLAIFLAICFVSLAGVLPSLLLPKIFLLNSSIVAGLPFVVKHTLSGLTFMSPFMSLLISFSIALSSLAGAFYYFYIIKLMFAEEADSLTLKSVRQPIERNYSVKFVSSVLLLAGFIVAFIPNFFLKTVSRRGAVSAVYSSRSIEKDKAGLIPAQKEQPQLIQEN